MSKAGMDNGHKGAHKINTSVLTSNIGRPNISILI